MNQEQENLKEFCVVDKGQSEELQSPKGQDLNFLIQNAEKDFYNSVVVPDTKDLV